MKAALTFGPGDIRVESMTDPVPDAGEILVKVGGCGICGGDYSGHKPGARKLTNRREPTIAGHEVAGTVAAHGAGGARFAGRQPGSGEPESALWTLFAVPPGNGPPV